MIAFGDVDGGVPADVAASEGREAGFAVASEYTLLAVLVLEVASGEMRLVAVDDRWIAAALPRVLVAQSLVGREGLNLHEACRCVVLLHPEWNPGVVEQKIGRIDRVNSHWSRELHRAINAGEKSDELPRIEVHPIIFRGTYDEWNWDVLQGRWDSLRAQLHGMVIPPGEYDAETLNLINEIESRAPNFSPVQRTCERL